MNYLLSRAMIDGKIGLHIFTDDAVKNPEVLKFGERVQMSCEPVLRAKDAGGRPCRVTVRLKDGRTYSRDAEHSKGSPEYPMTDDELKAKFMECAREAINASTAERVLDSVQRLETLGNIRPLCELLVP